MRPTADPRPVGALAIAAIALFAHPAAATTVARLSRAALVRAASAIVWGRCESAESFLREDGLLATRITFRVSESLKGDPGERFVLVQLGGTVGDRTLLIPGAPRFAPGEEVIIFVAGGDGPGKPAAIVGLAQGKFEVYWDASARIRRVRRSLGALSVVPSPRTEGRGPKAAAESVDAPSPSEHPPLESFLAEIRDLVAAEASGGEGRGR